MFSCKEVSVLVSAALDRRLTYWERLKVRLHLFICKACANFSKQMTVLRAATRRLAEERDTASMSEARLSEQARTRIRDVLQGHERHDDHPR